MRIKIPARSARIPVTITRDSEVNESHDSDKNEIDGQQEHSEIFCDHGLF